MIPNHIHFIFGLKPDFGGKPFNMVHYLAIKSAHDVNRPDAIYFYYAHEPSGEWWEKAKPYLTLVQIEPPTEIFGRPLLHVAHQAGVMRLQALHEVGGIYLDIDTICVKPFANLLYSKCVLGIQGSKLHTEGLCDAVIMSEPNSPFIEAWLMSYQTHRSKGRDEYWAEHAVTMPYILSTRMPEEITVLPYTAFHNPLYHAEGITSLFTNDDAYPESYCHHLWEQVSWDTLNGLTEDTVKTVDTTYNRIARRFL